MECCAAWDIRVRIVEYSQGYLADHGCEKEYVLYVLEGVKLLIVD